MSTITNARAQKVISGAKRVVVELGVAASIAVHDDGGRPIAFSRMDGTAHGLELTNGFDQLRRWGAASRPERRAH